VLKTRLTEKLGLRHPIIQAGMGGVARWRLVTAVSNAGGLGVLGVGLMPLEEMRREIRQIKEHTDRPYGVDLLLAEGTPNIEALMETLFAEEVPIFVSGLGDPGRWVKEMHARRMKVIALVGNVQQARRCADSGVDIIVAQGHEAGGHTGRIATMVLVPAVVDAVAPIPVVAAGGIGDGRGLAAALMLGAQGALVGTRFIATPEANCHAGYKDKLVQIGVDGTVVTRAYTGKPCRVVRNRYTEQWEGREREIKPFPLQLLAAGEHAGAAMQKGETEFGFTPAGQVSGLVHDQPGAAELVDRIAAEAEAILAEARGQYVVADEAPVR